MYCTPEQHVYLIDLASQGLQGTLSDAIDLSPLQQLRTLWLQENQLKGTIPASWFSNVPSLQEVMLYDNGGIEGSLPAAALSSAPKLKKLNVNGNLLSGSLPGEVLALSNLEELSLAGNSFEGTIPSAFGDLAKLKTL